MRKSWKKYTFALLAVLLVVYVLGVNFPKSSILAHKMCSSWVAAQNEVFYLQHRNEMDHANVALASSYVAPKGTASKVAVLMYHYIVPAKDNTEPKNNSIIDLEAFEKDMKYLHDNHYHTATLQELEKFVNGQASLPENTVVLSFDDGYQNNMIYAYPIMKKYGFHATMFVIGSKIQPKTEAFDPHKTSYVSREEMQATSDVFEFNSHTYNLHFKEPLHCGDEYAAGMDPNRFVADDHIMRTEAGINTPYFAYPYGDFRMQMIYALKQCGFRMAFTVHQGFVRPGDDPYQLKRLTVISTTNLGELLHMDHDPDGSAPVAF
ncbi:polysaccharide deacetylase family protein [Paenibacillus campi]|uniref:polysaccharide deacetylase family protein n=1 Tax=Paenibacillus campi TaxID=3106031 RepID=UPI002AFF41A4|nr:MULTISPECIES: polysaccharide deacetylase family protein [unclassified Paenibacillus]